MEIFNMEQPVNVICVTATSFPESIGAAWNKLHGLFNNITDRTYYGLSCGDGKNGIIYKAAAREKFDGEAEQLGCEGFTIRAGNYLGAVLKNWKKDETIIGRTFQQLLKDERIDHEAGYCLEIYLNEQDVQCMVKMID